jgi:hypothetical protein
MRWYRAVGQGLPFAAGFFEDGFFLAGEGAESVVIDFVEDAVDFGLEGAGLRQIDGEATGGGARGFSPL